MHGIWPVVLCGGGGTRLWPLSLHTPKPLMRLGGPHTLLRQTVDRVAAPGFGPPLLVVGAAHADAVRAEVPSAQLLVEPCARGTAAAVLAAALLLHEQDPDAVLLVLPADHAVSRPQALHDAVRAGLPAARAGCLVTFGETPDRPATGYGWIQVGPQRTDAPGTHDVARFLEKPDRATAAHLLARGGHLWNSGMFLSSASALRAEAAQHAPDLLDAVTDAVAQRAGDTIDEAALARAPKGSFDVLLMERTARAAVVPVDLGWDDLGTWDAVAQHHPAPAGLMSESGGSWALSTGPAVVVDGIEDALVVATPDAVLVLGRGRSQRVGELGARAPAAPWSTRVTRLPVGVTTWVHGTLVRGAVEHAGRRCTAGCLVDGDVTAVEPSEVVEIELR